MHKLSHNKSLLITESKVLTLMFSLEIVWFDLWLVTPQQFLTSGPSLCPGEDVRAYIAGPPGPPGPPGGPGFGGYPFNTQELAERVFSLMNGEFHCWLYL